MHLNVENPYTPKQVDIGHCDLWAAGNVPQWFREPLHQWLPDHYNKKIHHFEGQKQKNAVKRSAI